MATEKLLVSIYKSPKKQEMYLYLEKSLSPDELPEGLGDIFGQPVHVMDLLLHEGRPLARASVADVMMKIREEGYYLQMPPSIVDMVSREFTDRHQ